MDIYDVVEQKLLAGNFDVGDYLLVAVPKAKRRGKLEAIWKGPYRVTSIIDPRVYEVEHLVTKDKKEVHAIRLRYFADSKLEVTEEILDEVKSDGNYDGMFDVEKIVDVKFNRESIRWEFLIKWKGFDELESTWEGFEDLLITIPQVVRNYVDAMADGTCKSELLEVLRSGDNSQNLSKKRKAKGNAGSSKKSKK
jgi:hypothetical protein